MKNAKTKKNSHAFFWTAAVIIAAVAIIVLTFPRPRTTVPDDTAGADQNVQTDVAAALISVTAPASGAAVTSPLLVSGEARGTWYFEADFPLELVDANGALLAQGVAQAQESWMTEDFVPFKATLTFAAPATEGGTLLLRKSNPSGLPENDSELRVPVRFSSPPRDDAAFGGGKPAAGGCVVSGCSSQLCGEEEQVSTCEYRPEYACYQKAVCERQPDKKCAWTLDVELLECLNNTAGPQIN